VKIADALAGVRTLFLDTAPLIYYVENVAPYRKVMDSVVAQVESSALFFVTSPITLAECLVHPLRRGDAALWTPWSSTSSTPISAPTRCRTERSSRR
jgi:hypothetical protein